MKKKKLIIVATLASMSLFSLTGCSQTMAKNFGVFEGTVTIIETRE